MNTQKAILAIDAVTAAIVNGVINTAFIDKLIYGELDNELYKHVLNKWASKKGDVFDFYLNSNDDIKRWLLEALDRSEEHTSELHSQSTISYAVFCLKKKKK